jgi:hypothetical protein
MQNKLILQESFLHFNNEIVLSNSAGVHSQNILLLLPHCLQNPTAVSALPTTWWNAKPVVAATWQR